MGNAQKSEKLYDDALESYNRAIRFNPNSYEAWFGKGLVEESLGQYREALRSYETAISIKPNWDAAIDAFQRIEARLYN